MRSLRWREGGDRRARGAILRAALLVVALLAPAAGGLAPAPDGASGVMRRVAYSAGGGTPRSGPAAASGAGGQDRELFLVAGGPPAVGLGRAARGRAPGRGFKGVVAHAAADLDAYWRVEAPPGWRYRSPRVRRFAAPLWTACGPIVPGVGPAYCPRGRTIYVDMAVLAELPLGRGGRLYRDRILVTFALAHEWAHHAQALAGVERSRFPDAPGEVLNVQMELHADCLAGAWLGAAEAAGVATDVDVQRAAAFAFALGDRAGARPASATAHGTPGMRRNAVLTGVDGGGPQACAALLAP